MKFDMHCHTKEGSIDAKVPIEEYIGLLKEQGFGGMLITDHDSYKGYRAWYKTVKGKKHRDFVVLRGIEYDTRNGGHILVILPEGVHLPILEFRGMPVQLLIRMVHHYGGILGPAHPFGERHMSFVTTQWAIKKRRRGMDKILKQFDFIEIYNACESEERNAKAEKLAKRYEKPGFGGSDSHKPDCVGTGYTILPDWIRRESDLIRYVKKKPEILCGGTGYFKTIKGSLGFFLSMYAKMFFWYNHFGALFHGSNRKRELKKDDNWDTDKKLWFE